MIKQTLLSLGIVSFVITAYSYNFNSNSNSNFQPSHAFEQYAYNKSRHYRSEYYSENRYSSRPATGRRVFIYNPHTLTWRAYDSDGSLIRSGRGSGGRSYCPDVRRRCKTPVGTFRVYAKAGPSYRSKRFPLPRGGAPMPWAMFFYRGFAIHGSYDLPHYNASHGCIRVLPADARWLNTAFLNHGSTVIVQPY